jgi:carbonic anhydrase
MKKLEKLKSGFREFRKHYFEDDPELYKHLTAEGQSPIALVIACCDSRVHPTQIMRTDPGDIFVVRNVANLVPAYVDDGKTHGTSAAIEFAVKHLKVPHIIVVGHSKCGGIRALMEGKHEGKLHKFIDPWMAIMASAREEVSRKYPDASLDDKCAKCERAAIGVSLENLLSFPFVRRAVESGDIQLHGWYFDFEQGELFIRKDDGEYAALSQQP